MKRSFEICRCVLVREKEMEYITNDRIASSSEIAEIARELGYDTFSEECFGLFCLNAKGEIINYSEVSHGDLCSSLCHPREIFKRALLSNAGSLIFVHNHPSGDCTPSGTDIETTKRLCECGVILGIPVLDHIVIGDAEYYSMKAHSDI